jgi:hypothetical protein
MKVLNRTRDETDRISRDTETGRGMKSEDRPIGESQPRRGDAAIPIRKGDGSLAIPARPYPVFRECLW